MKFRLLAALFAVILLWVPSTAAAYNGSYPYSCDPNRGGGSGQYHLQWNSVPGVNWYGNLNPRGIEATVDHYRPFIDSIGRWSLANIMLANTSTGPYLYAQVGWKENWFNGHVTNITWTDEYGNQQQPIELQNYNNSDPLHLILTWYVQPYNGYIHHFNFYVEGHLLKQVGVNWTPNKALTLAETFGDSSQMAGDTIQHTRFTSVYDLANGVWRAHGSDGTVYTINEKSSWFGITASASTWADVWDKYCP